MPKDARLHLHLSDADKAWLEDHATRFKRRTRRHITVAEVIADAIAVYRELIESGTPLDPAYPTK